MLQDKFLPVYHFSERHAIEIGEEPSRIWPLLEQRDFTGSWLVKLLIWIRGVPSTVVNAREQSNSRFIVLETKQNEEIIIGLVGQFWKPAGNLVKFEPADFVNFHRDGFAKASWNFVLRKGKAGSTLLETETRILCMDRKAKRRFRIYWFFVRPFSGIIRMEILRGIRKSVLGSVARRT